MKRKTSPELKVVNPVRTPRKVLNSPTVKRDIISNGVKQKILTEPKKNFGLCSCCSCAPACTYSRDSGRPVLQCEEFDGISHSLNQMVTWVGKPSVNRFSEPTPDAQSLGILRGLCAYCDGLNTCTYPKPEGGVWHCDEYC